MRSIYLDEARLKQRTAGNEAFWQGTLPDYPIIWITAPDPKPGYEIPAPATEAGLWTEVEYVVQAAHSQLAQTYFAGDSLPVYNPWLGPDQFAAWLGADLVLKPHQNTSWSAPFVDDWADYPTLDINPQNRWWKLYLELLRACAEFGQDKWITGYPDLHSGLDALCAVRGPEKVMMDMITRPDIIRAQMSQMTRLWKYVVDTVTGIIAPYGQGTSNWTMGYSSRRFVCVGQNDFTCMISPAMFDEFCLQDNVETCRHVDCTLYHLDGPNAIKHVPALLKIRELTAIQWVQGAGQPPPGHWIDLFRQVQEGGKCVQALYLADHALTKPEMLADLEKLLLSVDVTRLFIWGEAPNRAQADQAVDFIKRTCDRKKHSR
jgi:hypothetical protein